MLFRSRRLDTPDKPEQRQRAGLVISPELVQRALRVVALRSHRQGVEGKPLFQPLEFSEALARQALVARDPEGLALTAEEAKAVLGYLMELRLLLRPGVAVGRLRFPLDPLADHLAAAEQFEQLELPGGVAAAGSRGAEGSLARFQRWIGRQGVDRLAKHLPAAATVLVIAAIHRHAVIAHPPLKGLQRRQCFGIALKIGRAHV